MNKHGTHKRRRVVRLADSDYDRQADDTQVSVDDYDSRRYVALDDAYDGESAAEGAPHSIDFYRREQPPHYE
ncbi:hypothetical protein EML15_06805 [Corynebacterium sp. sy017]|uniref:hypothetical protein n=1 Tax=unclassified Corynebacterium TaxID=2624378 RepID=UPI001184A808|nr:MULTISPECIES: hypothetical protein [unclassified Corynebacterium]MBP3088852.1 hypothetical protein [Corynebacterium sp. sy017]QDZ42243.1 hypothetical protein FQV43_02960 [Corynebacterium sp. sy039]TSD91194.1 hypothetical protein ELY17_06815 [Corynebacterium sp. SY003]